MPADKVNSITQTKDGYLWLATQNGLLRFDGLDFQIVPIDLPTSHGHEVRMLAKSHDGSFWFIMNGGGFGRYDGKRFYADDDKRLAGLELNTEAIMEAQDGALWLGNSSELGRWVNEKSAHHLATNAMPSGVITLCEGAGGRIWIGTAENGLFYLEGGKLVSFPDEPIRRGSIFALAVDPKNQLWVGTANGLLRCTGDGSIKPDVVLESETKALLVDRQGILWAGTTGMGLGRFENGQFRFLKKADGLGSDNITALFEDLEGSLWVGSRNGLNQLSDIKFPVISDRDGIGAGSCHSVFATTNRVLIGTDNGLSQFRVGTGTIYDVSLMLPNIYIKLAFQARNGDVYTEDGRKVITILSGSGIESRLTNSTWADAFAEDAKSVLVGMGDHLCRLQEGKMTPYEYKHDPPPDYYWINNIFVSNDDAIWVASNNGVFRIQNGIVTHWAMGNTLSEMAVFWLCEDVDGVIWAGLGTGIARVKDAQLNFIRTGNGLPDDQIFAIVPDDLGFLWCDSSRGIFKVSRTAMNDVADGKARRVECVMYDSLESVRYTDRTDQENSGCKTSDGHIFFPSPCGVITIDSAHIPTNRVEPPVHIHRVLANGKEYDFTKAITVPPGKGELQINFTALSLIGPEKLRFRYRLDDYDKDWVETEERRLAFYANLKPGRYTFHVIAANADRIWNNTGDSIEIELQPHFYQTFWFYLLQAVLFIAVLAGIFSWRLRHHRRRQHKLQKARHQLETEVRIRTAELASANDSLRITATKLEQRTAALEAQIKERGRMELELEQTHRRLLETSWRAGMAEVASNVLHNIGNVLNSVNISASIINNCVRHSKTANLAKVASLLREHRGDLTNFLMHDPRGKMVPDYLQQLSSRFTDDQAITASELASMCGHIEHIKEIVAMQQSYAKVSGVKEEVSPAELMETSLQINAATFQRNGVTVIREFEPVPKISVEKHKVLQILNNLIRNALDACEASSNADPRLVLKIKNCRNCVKIAVSDNGVGIPTENLTRIFSHGFTTKKNGHGFGLHSGALAAKEIGGALTAHSEGFAKGSTFILELPYDFRNS